MSVVPYALIDQIEAGTLLDGLGTQEEKDTAKEQAVGQLMQMSAIPYALIAQVRALT